jgi:hypothetical protein
MWNLQMNKREKLIILFSLSLGVMYDTTTYLPSCTLAQTRD